MDEIIICLLNCQYDNWSHHHRKKVLKMDCIISTYSLSRVTNINLWNDHYPLIGILILPNVSLAFVDHVV